MIRHSSSFFISLVFHTLIAVLVVFAYKNALLTKEEVVEKKVCIELCNVVEQKPIIPPAPKPIVEPKIEPKPIIEKPKSKPKPAPKKVIKKEIIKEVPVVMPEPEPIVEQEVVEEKKIIKEVVEQIKEQDFEQEPQKIIKEEVIKSKEVKLEREYMQEHLAKIVQLLRDNLYYPRRARAMREEGEVIVKFTLSRDGKTHSIEVISSKSKILSRSAIRTIEDLSGEFPKPKEELTLHVPIDYSLR